MLEKEVTPKLVKISYVNKKTGLSSHLSTKLLERHNIAPSPLSPNICLYTKSEVDDLLAKYNDVECSKKAVEPDGTTITQN